MATLATGLLASFGRTGFAPVGFLQVVSPTSFLVPPLPRFSQRDRSLSEIWVLNAQYRAKAPPWRHPGTGRTRCVRMFPIDGRLVGHAFRPLLAFLLRFYP